HAVDQVERYGGANRLHISLQPHPYFIIPRRARRRSPVYEYPRRVAPTEEDEKKICQQQRQRDEEQNIEDQRERYRTGCGRRHARWLGFRRLLDNIRSHYRPRRFDDI